MKNILILLIIILIPLNALADELVPISGCGCYIFGDNDTPAKAQEIALLNAKRNAIENCVVHVSSVSEMNDFTLTNDMIRSISEGCLYKMKIERRTENGREICIEITAEARPSEIKEAIYKKRSRLENVHEIKVKTIPPMHNSNVNLPDPIRRD